MLVALVFAAVFAGPIEVPLPSGAEAPRLPGLSAYAPDDLAGEPLAAPSVAFPMGTDRLGRDVRSRVLYGARVSLRIGVVSVAVATVLGALLGVTTAYWASWPDLIAQRLLEIVQAFPLLVLVLALVAVFGTSEVWVIFALVVALTPSSARVVRGAAMAIRETPYVEAARCAGAGDLRILFVHILPNVLAPVIVVASNLFGLAIVTEAAVSFLGLGPPPPAPTWGAMLADRQYATLAPWTVLAPGLAVSLAVLGFNLLADALRDVLDPRLRA
jgi:ABC-type dipeptide/oligopeptide/nickel transport system permease subunit